MPEQRVQTTVIERWYLLVRAVGFVMFGVVLFVMDLGVTGSLLFAELAAFGVFVFTSALVLGLRFWRKLPLQTVLLVAAPLDLAWLGLLTYALHDFEDPVVLGLLAVAIFYAFSLRSAKSLFVIGAASGVYIMAHILSPGCVPRSPEFAFVLLNGGAIIYLGAIAMAWARHYEEREQLVEAQAREKQELTEELQHRVEDLQAVSQITEIVHSSLDFDRVGQLVLDILVKVLDLPACALFVMDKQKAETLFSSSVGVAGIKAPTHLEGAARGVQTLFVSDEHFTCQAIHDHQRMMVVFCAPTDALDNLNDQDRLVLQAVASELVVAVENSHLYKLTQRLAITDELTGLHNYRYLQQRLDEEIERAKRYGKELSLIMLDVDDFKLFNDRFGHMAGDAALAELSAVIRRHTREVDVVARYGGEEFSIVLPETDAAGAFVAAEKVREAVALYRFQEDEADEKRMTISMGLATYPTHAHDKESLLTQADHALYQAKSSGKNRVRSPLAGKGTAGGVSGVESDQDIDERGTAV